MQSNFLNNKHAMYTKLLINYVHIDNLIFHLKKRPAVNFHYILI